MTSSEEKMEYLCQVGDTISCGNCCGLYNVPDASFEKLNRMLDRRTRLFAATPRDMDAILAYKDRIRQKESADADRPVFDFHHCPYIGFVGPVKKTVGCLLHPAADGNRGVDLRGLSFYGSFTCNMYFCPSARQLSARYGQIVKAFAEDWYQYGLIITEKALLCAFFEEIESRIGTPLTLALCRANPELGPLLVQFFRLKINWPHRPKRRAYLSNYFFNDDIYPKPRIPYVDLGLDASRYDRLFTELTCEFDTSDDVKSAETLLDDLFNRIGRAAI